MKFGGALQKIVAIDLNLFKGVYENLDSAYNRSILGFTESSHLYASRSAEILLERSVTRECINSIIGKSFRILKLHADDKTRWPAMDTNVSYSEDSLLQLDEVFGSPNTGLFRVHDAKNTHKRYLYKRPRPNIGRQLARWEELQDACKREYCAMLYGSCLYLFYLLSSVSLIFFPPFLFFIQFI